MFEFRKGHFEPHVDFSELDPDEAWRHMRDFYARRRSLPAMFGLCVIVVAFIGSLTHIVTAVTPQPDVSLLAAICIAGTIAVTLLHYHSVMKAASRFAQMAIESHVQNTRDLTNLYNSFYRHS